MNDNQTNSTVKTILPIALIVVVVVAAVLVYTNRQTNEPGITTPTPAQTTTQQVPAPTGTDVLIQEGTSAYADGVYQASGNYVSPGGPREIQVSLTLENGIITSSTFQGGANDPTSQRFQGEFANNYQAQVIGRNVDEISLTKVAGSSLTPIGFTDALNKIKQQARS